MKNYINLCKNTSLFRNMNEDEILRTIQLLHGKKRTYLKNEILFLQETTLKYTCLLLSGSLDIYQITLAGETTLLKQIQPGEVFAYALSVQGSCPDSIEVTTVSTCEILFLDTSKLLEKSPEQLTDLEIRIIQNLTLVMVQKNMMLNRKIQIISQNTLRQKLLLYLNFLSKEQNSSQVTLPLTKEKLSRFLASNRSAISRALTAMQTDGLIEIHGNIIKLL